MDQRAPQVKDERVPLNGIRIHYRDWGDPTGPPLVLIHGSGLTARAYDSLACGLAERFRVLVPDMRGHGESDQALDYDWERAYDDLASFVRALDLPAAGVIGHSMGARISAIYAARQPDRVRALVLVDWAPGATFTPEYAQALAQLFGMLRIDDPESVLEAARVGQPRLRETEFRHVIESGLRPLAEGGWAWRLDPAVLRGRDQAFPIDHETATSIVRRVCCPTLVVRAAQSQYVTREQAERAVGLLGDGQLVEIPESGHGLPWEQPEQLLQVCRSFLTRQAEVVTPR
jgi:pimeloyl-ACP methyl ester carboxylesterase